MAALLLAACSSAVYRSRATQRPIVGDWLPSIPQQRLLAKRLASPTTSARAIKTSLRHTTASLSSFRFRQYGQPSSYHSIARLANALDRFPDNPYAWIGLGAYLGISFQPAQAATASRLGVEAIRQHVAVRPDLEPIMRPALSDGLLNLADFSLQAGEVEQAFRALEQLRELPELEDPRRLAFLRLQVLAQLAVGDTAGARQALAQLVTAVEELSPSRPGSVPWYSRGFPLYLRAFSAKRRRATNEWLEGRILLAEGSYDEAIKAVERSIRTASEWPRPTAAPPTPGGDVAAAADRTEVAPGAAPVEDLDRSELWEAHLTLAEAYFRRAAEADEPQRAADLALARGLLEEIVVAIPGHDFTPSEYVAFSLGNVLFAEGDYKAAIKRYRAAVHGFHSSFAALREAWLGYVVRSDPMSRTKLIDRRLDGEAADPAALVVYTPTPSPWTQETLLLRFLLSNPELARVPASKSHADDEDQEPVHLRLLREGLASSFVGLQPEAAASASLRQFDIDPATAGLYVYGEAYNNMGNAYFELGLAGDGAARKQTWEDARRSYRIALLDNRYATPEAPHLRLARIALEEGNTATAYAQLLEALNLSPLLRVALEMLLEASERSGDPAEAAGGLYLVVDHLEQIGGREGARRGWTAELLTDAELQLASLAPTSQSRAVAARIQHLRGDDRGAMASFYEMSRSDPASIWPWAGLVRVEAPGMQGQALGRGIELVSDRRELAPWTAVDYRFLLHKRAELELERGELCGALADFSAALEASPGWHVAERDHELAQERARQQGVVCQ